MDQRTETAPGCGCCGGGGACSWCGDAAAVCVSTVSPRTGRPVVFFCPKLSATGVPTLYVGQASPPGEPAGQAELKCHGQFNAWRLAVLWSGVTATSDCWYSCQNCGPESIPSYTIGGTACPWTGTLVKTLGDSGCPGTVTATVTVAQGGVCASTAGGPLPATAAARAAGPDPAAHPCRRRGKLLVQAAGCFGGARCTFACRSRSGDVLAHLGGIRTCVPAVDCVDCPGYVPR